MSSESIGSHPIYSNTEAPPAVTDTGINVTEVITTAIDSNNNLKPKEKEEIKEWIKNKKELRIIATGKTGAGKSSLLNSFIGEKLFEEGEDLDPHTMMVDQRSCKKDGIHVIAWDCPGLQDGTDNEEEYLKDLAEKTEKKVDLMLYCVDMNASRAVDLRVHGSAIKKLTDIVGPEVWGNTVIALTFANMYETRLCTTNVQITNEILAQKFQERIDLWKTKLQEVLCEVGVAGNVVNALPVFPAGYRTTPHLPGYPLWASCMWLTMLYAVKEYAQPLPIVLNLKRFKDKVELSDEHFFLPPEEQPIFVSGSFPYHAVTPICTSDTYQDEKFEGQVIGTSVGAGLGVAGGTVAGVITGVAVGVTAGTTAGAVVGGIAFGALTFGVGTFVGVAVGAGLGFGIGTATGLLIDVYRRNKQKKES